MAKKKKECSSCLLNLATDVVKNLCKLENNESLTAKCDKIIDKLSNKKISLDEYLDKIEKLFKDDEDFVFTINSLRTVSKKN